MAKKRKTLKEKKAAAQRAMKHTRSMQLEPSLPTPQTISYKPRTTGTVAVKTQNRNQNILSVNEELIKADLKKTLILSIGILVLLAGIYWFVDLGGRAIVGLE